MRRAGLKGMFSKTSKRHRFWNNQRGFSLLETIAAVFIMGTVVVAVVSVMGTSSRMSIRAQESVTLLRLVRSQIEAIQQSPFQQTPANYPAVSDVPEGFTVSFSATDPGTTYTYPPPLGTTTLTNLVQQITVTATGDYSSMNMTFYKIQMP